MRKTVLLITLCYIGFSCYYIYTLLKSPRKFTSLDEKKTEGVSCSYPTIKEANEATYNQLQELLRTSFFQTFKINFDTDCPFWAKNSRCSNRKCLLYETPSEQIPEFWKNSSSDQLISREALKTQSQLAGFLNNNTWSVESQENANGSYLSLIENPESFTGYSGTNIWPIIYKENTFKGKPDSLPLSKQLFNRVISGLHASTSAHIAELYADPKNPDKHAPNCEFFFERVGNFPDRVENIYFAYSFVLRAVQAVAPFLEYYNLTYDANEDAKLRSMVNNIIGKTAENCPFVLKVESYFENKTSKNEIYEQIQKLFVNVSQIIECVECERCRVHAKLQIYGLGTAFKILFSDNTAAELVNLRRNELISLINALGKLSESLHAVDLMHERRAEYFKGGFINLTLGFICIGLITQLVKFFRDFNKKDSEDKTKPEESEKKPSAKQEKQKQKRE